MNNFHTIFKEESVVIQKSTAGKMHVAVLAGGMSSEREVSLSLSIGVTKALIEKGYRVTLVDMGTDVGHVLRTLKPDVVYNCLHGTYGEDGCVPGLLNIMRIPYTHAGVLGSALAFNKIKSREVFLSNGIKCADAKLISKSDGIMSDPMPRPYVIKPISQGSSIGVEIVFKEDNFDFGAYTYEYGEEILVEKYIKARELQVAVLNGASLGILEIKLLKKRFYDYEAKYTEGFTEHIVPAQIPDDVYAKTMTTAEKACKLLHAYKGICRVEFLYEEHTGEIYILEVNTHPGMTSLSICPEIAAHVGISYADLVEKVLSGAKYEE